MAFKPKKTVSGQDIKKCLIDNSQTLSIGEAIIPGIQGDTSVVLTGGSTTGDLLGVVLGLEGKDGKVLELTSKAVASDNVTVAMISASYFPLYIPMEFYGVLDAAAETTDNSGTFGNFALDSTGLLLTESSVVAFSTKSSKQFFSFGLTGKNTTEVSGIFIATIVA